MSELWIPSLGPPDVSNVFDMMTVFQERLDQFPDARSGMNEAVCAVKALCNALRYLEDADREVTVATSGAILPNTEGDGMLWVEEDMELNGALTGEVQAKPLNITGRDIYHLTLELDVLNLAYVSRPSDSGLLFREGSVPISSVQSIETAA